MNFAHPAFAPYRPLLAALDFPRRPPRIEDLDALARWLGPRNSRGRRLRFVATTSRFSARDYECAIYETGIIPTRPDHWHDTFNALVWLRFPHTKRAINAAHVAALPGEAGHQRSPRRDALTLLDESGVVVSGDPALCALLAARQWYGLFCDARERVVATMHFVVIGHALLEKALAPYPAMTGKCLVLDASPPAPADDAIAAALARIASPRQLPPLPIQGIPGWDPDNVDTGYYTNTEVFRP